MPTPDINGYRKKKDYNNFKYNRTCKSRNLITYIPIKSYGMVYSLIIQHLGNK